MSDKPKRIQRKRTKGWRMPEGAVYVGRPSKYGNPYKSGDRRHDVYRFRAGLEGWIATHGSHSWLNELRGKDLVCWCPLDQPCHADVLLELANDERTAA